MSTKAEALRLMLTAIAAMREAGYTQEDVAELAREVWEHLEGGGQQPQDSGRRGHSPPLPGPSTQRPSPRSGANPVSGVGENSPLSALEIQPHLDLYCRSQPNRAQLACNANLPLIWLIYT